MLMTVLHVIHWVSALLIVIEAINKLDGCDIVSEGRTMQSRFSALFKALAWIVMALAAAGAMAGPFFRSVEFVGVASIFTNPVPSLGETGLFAGFAILILRSWVNVLFTEAETARKRRSEIRQIAAANAPRQQESQA